MVCKPIYLKIHVFKDLTKNFKKNEKIKKKFIFYDIPFMEFILLSKNEIILFFE